MLLVGLPGAVGRSLAIQSVHGSQTDTLPGAILYNTVLTHVKIFTNITESY